MIDFFQFFSPIMMNMHYLGGWATFSELENAVRKDPNFYHYSNTPDDFKKNFFLGLISLRMAGLIDDVFFPEWIYSLTRRGQNTAFVDEGMVWQRVMQFTRKSAIIIDEIKLLERDSQIDMDEVHTPDWMQSLDDLDAGYWNDYFLKPDLEEKIAEDWLPNLIVEDEE